MKEKVSDHSIKVFTVLFALCFFCLIFVSCDFGNLFDPTFDDSFEEYLDYWASTCQVGQIDYVSSHVKMEDGENLSAQDKIELEIIVINPKEYNLLCKNGGGHCFSFINEAGNLAYSEYTEEVVDATKIKITARLTDASEGQKITLTGCLWPENTSNFTEELLRRQNKDLFYSTSFIQNTPPEGVKNVYVPPYTMNNKHYVSFEIPDQTKNRNKGVKFEIQYYLRENGALNFKGSKVVSLSDNKTPGNIFTYYFDEQEDFLAYEYSVKVWGGRGLSIEQVSTDPGLGVHVMVEPTITFGTPFTGHTDAQGFKYIEVDSSSATVAYTIMSDEAGAELSGTIDGVPFSGTQNGNLTAGAHTLVATVHKDYCRDVTVTKKIKIVQSLGGASFTFDVPFNGSIDTNGYEYIEVDTASSTVPYTIGVSESGTTITGSIDGVAYSGTKTGTLSVGPHTLVATIHKDLFNDNTVTRKIMVVKKLEGADFTFDTLFNGNTDANGYEYVEVDTASSTVTYSIEIPTVESSVAGTTITGTVDDTPFDGVQDGLPLAVGEHTLVATIHRDNFIDKTVTRKIKVVKKLYAASVEFVGTTYNTVDDEGFTYYEVDTASSTIDYTIESEDDTTMTVVISGTTSSTETTATNTKDGSLGIGEYTITVTVHKPCYNDKLTGTKKIMVVQKLQKPTLAFYSNSARTNVATKINGLPENHTYDSYNTFDISLNSSGNGALYYTFTAQETGATLKTDGSSSNNSSSLTLGPHTITLTVEKDYYKTQTFTEYVYVEGILSDAVVTSTLSPGVTTTNSGSLQFSYLNYNEMSVSVSAGNSGNTISSVTAGGASKGTSFSLAHGFNGNVVVVQTRTYCKTKTTTRSYAVTIKPVTAYVPVNDQMWMYYDGDDAGDEGEIYGTVYLGYNGGNWSEVRSFNDADFAEGKYDIFNHAAWSCILYSPSDSVSIKTSGMYEDDPTDNDDIGEVQESIALSSLKGDWTWIVDNHGSYDCHVYWKTQYTLYE